MTLCACGCGKQTNMNNKWILGHNSRCKSISSLARQNARKSLMGHKNWHTDESKRKISIKLKGIKRSEETKKKMSMAKKGQKVSKETKKLISISKKGSIPWNKGLFGVQVPWNKGKQGLYKTSKETREKLRKLKIRYVEHTKLNGMPLYPTIGKDEKHILDTLEECFNYPILRQHKVAGYFLDGYCPALNLAIEVDEEYHINPKVKTKDIEKEQVITQKIRCSFLRIDTTKRGGFSG